MTSTTGAAVTGSHKFGPVDVYLLGLKNEQPDPAALGELTGLVSLGLLCLLDLVLVSRSEAGDVTIIEATEIPDGFEIDVATLGARGLIGHKDIERFATVMLEGTAALLIAVELVYQRELAAKTEESGAELLAYERIPAPVVNALLDTIMLTEKG